MQRITDQGILDYLNGKTSVDPTAPNSQMAINGEKINDQATLDYLNGKSSVDPTVATKKGIIQSFLNSLPKPPTTPNPAFSKMFQANPTAEGLGAIHGLDLTGLQAKENLYAKPLDYLLGGNRAAQVQQQINDLKQNSDWLKTSAESPIASGIGQALGQALPFAATAGVGAASDLPLAARIITQGAVGAGTSPSPLEGSLMGAGSEAIGSLISGAVGNAKQAIANAGKEALTNKVGTFTGTGQADVLDDFNNQIFDQSARNYTTTAVPNEMNAWKSLVGNSMIADFSPGVKFDPKSYFDSLQERMQQINSELKHNPDSINLQNDQKLLTGWMNAPLGSFQSAINHGKALNDAYRQTIVPGVPAGSQTINFAIKSFKNNLDENLENNGLSTILGDEFDKANQATINKQQTFHEITVPQGGNTPSSFINFIKNAGTPADPRNPYDFANRGNFIEDYIPGPKDGPTNIQKLGAMLGDQEKANNVILANLFKNVDSDTSYMNVFNNLKPSVQRQLYSPDQLTDIKKMASLIPKQSMGTKMRPTVQQLGINSAVGNSIAQSLSRLIPQAAFTQGMNNQQQ